MAWDINSHFGGLSTTLVFCLLQAESSQERVKAQLAPGLVRCGWMDYTADFVDGDAACQVVQVQNFAIVRLGVAKMLAAMAGVSILPGNAACNQINQPQDTLHLLQKLTDPVAGANWFNLKKGYVEGGWIWNGYSVVAWWPIGSTATARFEGR